MPGPPPPPPPPGPPPPIFGGGSGKAGAKAKSSGGGGRSELLNALNSDNKRGLKKVDPSKINDRSAALAGGAASTSRSPQQSTANNNGSVGRKNSNLGGGGAGGLFPGGVPRLPSQNKSNHAAGRAPVVPSSAKPPLASMTNPKPSPFTNNNNQASRVNNNNTSNNTNHDSPPASVADLTKQLQKTFGGGGASSNSTTSNPPARSASTHNNMGGNRAVNNSTNTPSRQPPPPPSTRPSEKPTNIRPKAKDFHRDQRFKTVGGPNNQMQNAAEFGANRNQNEVGMATGKAHWSQRQRSTSQEDLRPLPQPPAHKNSAQHASPKGHNTVAVRAAPQRPPINKPQAPPPPPPNVVKPNMAPPPPPVPPQSAKPNAAPPPPPPHNDHYNNNTGTRNSQNMDYNQSPAPAPPTRRHSQLNNNTNTTSAVPNQRPVMNSQRPSAPMPVPPQNTMIADNWSDKFVFCSISQLPDPEPFSRMRKTYTAGGGK